MSIGLDLINDIKNKMITKDHLIDNEKDFHNGYNKLYLYKFRKYQSSVGKFIRDIQLNDIEYRGI